mgnify:CR=1 FL=1
MYMRIRKAREDMGYTREKFAELLDVSVSYMAEVERGRTGISVKMLIKICDVLGLSADYVLFGEQRGQDAERLDRLNRIDGRYLPLLDSVIAELDAQLSACRQEQESCGSDYVRLQALTAEQERLTAELDAKTERWVYLNDLKERIDAQ